MPEIVLPDAFRCSYPFKFCNNRRAIKKSGEPHKLCQEHRNRANKYQRDLTTRHSQLKRRLQQTSSSTLNIDPQLSFADISDLLDDDTFLRVDCNGDDLKAVELLLSDTDSD